MRTIKEIEAKVQQIYEKYEVNRELYDTDELIQAYKDGVADGLREEVDIDELMAYEEEDRDDS